MPGRDLEAEINARLAAAERLLASGVMVGDADEQRLWRSSRDLWRAQTVRVLQDDVEERALRVFEHAVTPPAGEGTVSEDLPVELESVRSGMAVLIGVRSQLRRGVSEPPPETDRRGRRLGP